MDKQETRQAWRDLASHSGWSLLLKKCRDLQDREWSRILAECRTGNAHIPSYHVGFWEGIEKALDIPREEIERIDGQETTR